MRYVSHKASSVGAKQGLAVPSMVMLAVVGEVEVAPRVLQGVCLVLVGM